MQKKTPGKTEGILSAAVKSAGRVVGMDGLSTDSRALLALRKRRKHKNSGSDKERQMEKRIINCRIVTPTGITEGDIYIKDGTIAAIGSGCPETAETYDAAGAHGLSGLHRRVTTFSRLTSFRGAPHSPCGRRHHDRGLRGSGAGRDPQRSLLALESGLESSVCNYAVHICRPSAGVRYGHRNL
jgi:hypothetical protein